MIFVLLFVTATTWAVFNDSAGEEINVSDVLKQRVRTYLLFYQRVPKAIYQNDSREGEEMYED